MSLAYQDILDSEIMEKKPESIMERLPTELLLTILEELPYKDLKLSASLVCRRLHSIIKTSRSPAMQRKLFRDKPSEAETAKAIRRNECPFHPFLAARRYGSLRLYNQSFFQGHKIYHKRMLTELSVYDENATSPAVSELYVHVSGDLSEGVDLTASEGRGVTVGEVIRAVVEQNRGSVEPGWGSVYHWPDAYGHLAWVSDGAGRLLGPPMAGTKIRVSKRKVEDGDECKEWFQKNGLEYEL